MQFPKLTPLQCRFLASLLASLILFLIYYVLSNPHIAYAADVDSIIREDHNHPLSISSVASEYIYKSEGNVDSYEAEFGSLDRSVSGRSSVMIRSLANNAAQNLNIELGQSQYWSLPKDVVFGDHGSTGTGLPSDDWKSAEEDDETDSHSELKKRASTQTVYITLNTCIQPGCNATDDNNSTVPSQLQMYISTSSAYQTPGPDSDNPNQQVISVDGGFAKAILNVTGDVYIGVHAANSSRCSGIYNYEIAGSNDAPYHNYYGEEAFLHFVDSDTSAALFTTTNLTQADSNSSVWQQWMKLSPPFQMFANNQNNSDILGLHRSYCGLHNNAQITATTAKNDQSTGNVQVQMTSRGIGGKPKEQFYILSLNGSSSYDGFLAMWGNSTASGADVVGGGGAVWKSMSFSTKSDGNCQILFNFTFCSEVAYAVPSNTKTFPNLTKLTEFYDRTASSYYDSFIKTLAQVPCNVSNHGKYSLARTCDDCATAYKNWLCAVTVPRCEDFSSTHTFLQPRNIVQDFLNGTSPFSLASSNNSILNAANFNKTAYNSSRLLAIDESVQPGPYKEVLPCRDLCYDIVQSCPASFGFGCPTEGWGLEESYGDRSVVGYEDGYITCSYLGAEYFLGVAGSLKPVTWTFWISVLAALMVRCL